MGEQAEFAEALFAQLEVETGEEAQIASLAERIAGDAGFDSEFEPLAEAAGRLLPGAAGSLEELGLGGPAPPLEISDLREFKMLKAKKVFAPPGSRGFVDDLFGAVADSDSGAVAGIMASDMQKYLVYSTYAIQYLSKISTTYGDCLGGKIYLNGFVLSRYPQIVLYRQGPPYSGAGAVRSGYIGALKMALLEESVHSRQGPLQEMNAAAAAEVNSLNEELAGCILEMDEGPASSLYKHMQLQDVPPEFPAARKANLFFTLNPDNFVVNVLGPDVMTYDRIEVDPRISEALPGLPGLYRRWLGPIQRHHAAFTAMEGMAEFCVREALSGDPDFEEYLRTFTGTDPSAYGVRKSMGRDFVASVHARAGNGAFQTIMKDPPTTREIKEPGRYAERLSL